MSDEEKKAIKRLKKFGDSISCSDYPPEAYIGMKEDIEDILYLLEKQSKEIEELKQEKEYLNCIIESDKDNYINKDKIKAKIEEYLKYDKKYKRYMKDGRECFTMEYYYAKMLQSLLEKE